MAMTDHDHDDLMAADYRCYYNSTKKVINDDALLTALYSLSYPLLIVLFDMILLYL